MCSTALKSHLPPYVARARPSSRDHHHRHHLFRHRRRRRRRSHSWSASRWEKLAALLYQFNLRIALAWTAAVLYASFLANLMIGESLPHWLWLEDWTNPDSVGGGEGVYFQTSETFGPPVLVLVLLTAHWVGRRNVTAFLDIWSVALEDRGASKHHRHCHHLPAYL